jgi:hypothetical protein
MRHVFSFGRRSECVTHDTMWTPLLLICYVDSIDCAIPNAPAYMTEEQCLLALDDVLKTFILPKGMMIMGYDCYNWGLES